MERLTGDYFTRYVVALGHSGSCMHFLSVTVICSGDVTGVRLILPIIEAWGDSGNLPGDKSTAAKRNFGRRGAFLEPSVDSGQELEPSSCRWRVFGSHCDSLEVFYIFCL